MQLGVKYIYFYKIYWSFAKQDGSWHHGDFVRHMGDNRGWKEGWTLMGVAFLMKAMSPKWQLSAPIRSRRLTSPKRKCERRMWQNTTVQTSPIIVQENFIQYSLFHRETVSMCSPGLSNLTSASSWWCRYRDVLEANSTPNITHFTRAMPMLSTPDV